MFSQMEDFSGLLWNRVWRQAERDAESTSPAIRDAARHWLTEDTDCLREVMCFASIDPIELTRMREKYGGEGPTLSCDECDEWLASQPEVIAIVEKRRGRNAQVSET